MRTEDFIRVKRSGGSIATVVRERYLRNDIPCCSSLCGECENNEELPMLSSEVTHYVVPDCQVVRNFLEVLEADNIKGIIFMQTAMNSIQLHGNKRKYTRIRNMVKDRSKGCVVFNNEFHRQCYVKRKKDETVKEWQNRSLFYGTLWFKQHLHDKIPLIIISEDKDFLTTYQDHTIDLFVLTLQDYLTKFWPSLIDTIELYESLKESFVESASSGKKQRDYTDHLPVEVMQAGIKSGKLLKGFLRVNKHNSMQEAFVQTSRSGTKESEMFDILVTGQIYRNRAIHGDLVVVELLPKSEWGSRTNALSTEENEGNETVDSNAKSMPTGFVVGILQRCWRLYVATIPEENESSQRQVSEKILVIPWDYRIPKIRISTRNAEKLKTQRILVRIDSWERDSFYPNGHFVKSLGEIGNLETEIKAILTEHELDCDGGFSQGVLSEMPINTAEQPFEIEEKELKYRKDLRDHCLIFSIDPLGCEDVDDTLSVRKLKNGNIELGVHIADVTHFVKAHSLTDIEAARRSTTVYLADRRYDMLPGILSSDLCSLISGVDRYAVSVIWKFNENYQVLDVWYGRTIIRSSYKLHYEAAQSIADGVITVENISDEVPEMHGCDADAMAKRFAKLKEAIMLLMEIARHFKQGRNQQGAVELEGAEVQIEMTEGNVKDLTPKKSLEIHETVAECMIFANHWVGKKIEESFPANALLRRHPIPKQEFFEDLRACARVKGFPLDTSSNNALAMSLDGCVDPSEPEVNKILRTLATQAMSVALYFSTGSLPKDQHYHYGLALDKYTHFTSPIRRYADVLVHRMLLMAVNPEYCFSDLPTNNALEDICAHINVKHRESQHAQKDSLALFQVFYFKEREHDDEACLADGIVIKLKTNGVVVTVPRYGIKGAVYLKNKEGLVVCPTWDDQVEYGPGSLVITETSICIIHQSGENLIHLFDKIQVRIRAELQRSHPPSLKLNLTSLKTNTDDCQGEEFEQASIERKDIIKSVKADGEHKEGLRGATAYSDIMKHFEWEEMFRETHPELSLYQMFQNFRKTALIKE